MSIQPYRPYRPERALIEHMVADGMEADQAEAAVRAVVKGIADTLKAQKSVLIPDIGRLGTREHKRRYKGKATWRQKFRRAALISPGDVWEGEPYEVSNDPRR